MKIIWLGQAGLLFETNELKIMIDPYLSHSVEKVNSANYRRQPVNEQFFEIMPDVMIFTHDHLDHYDPETASRFLERKDKPMLVLCPMSVWGKVRQCGNGHNYVQFDVGTEWTEEHLRFTAVPAVHSDAYAIGVFIEDLRENKIYYITGDTLYNQNIFSYLPPRIDVIFLPINGVGNNMNQLDATRFAKRVGAKRIVPIHFGMFDDIRPEFTDDERCIVPEIYKEVKL